ncbi:Uncharacterised protein [Leclercia adecarboxylata]|nr:Uncharacterised protein [Leclercia adecarboxylata]
MVEDGCAVPVRVGVVSSVLCPFSRLPMMLPTLSFTLVMAGGFGTCEYGIRRSTVSPALPARSVAKTCSSSALTCGVVSVMLNFPVASATPVPSTVTLSVPRMVTVLPASAVPLTWPPLLSTVKPPGAPGATVSTVMEVTGDAALRLPAASVAVAVKLCTPSVRVVVVCASVHWPWAFAVTSPTRVVPS